VYLSKEDQRAIHATTFLERKIGLGLAAYFAVVSVVIHFRERPGAENLWRLGVVLLGVALFAAAAIWANRMVLGLGALAAVYLPVVEGPKASSLFFLFAIPLYAFMLWIYMFRINTQRRQIMEDRAARGDFGSDPRTRARQDHANKRSSATPVEGAKPVAEASRRFTPPGTKPKRR
jgi:hypothetical protein